MHVNYRSLKILHSQILIQITPIYYYAKLFDIVFLFNYLHPPLKVYTDSKNHVLFTLVIAEYIISIENINVI